MSTHMLNHTNIGQVKMLTFQILLTLKPPKPNIFGYIEYGHKITGGLRVKFTDICIEALVSIVITLTIETAETRELTIMTI